MLFADDSDLLRVQPSVFEHGVATFEDFHEMAGDEVVRDVRRVWGALVRAYGDTPLRVPDWGVRNFDAAMLNPVQWNMAAVYRVLGWHVLPMLHSSVTLDGTTLSQDGMKINDMRVHYRSEYEREFNAVLETGLEYDLSDGNGYMIVNRSSVAELQRLRR